MSCELQRQAFIEADTALTASIAIRNEADDAAIAAAADLEAAQAADAEAKLALAAAETEVTNDAEAADTAYSDYISCVSGDPQVQPIR